MNSQDQRRPAARSGKTYTNFNELLSGEGVSQGVSAKITELAATSRISTQLAQLRHRAGISQADMGRRIGKTQSAISKIEAGPDDNITIEIIRSYSQATSQRIGFMFGKPFTHAEAIKHNALAMRARMLELAKLANNENDFEKDIAAFFGEAFFNLLNIMSECSGRLPPGAETGIEIRMETYEKSAPNRAFPEAAQTPHSRELAPVT